MSESATGPTPSPYTNEWYAKQFRGIAHHYQRCMVEEAELSHKVVMLRKEVRELEEKRHQDMATIGEMQEQLQLMKDQVLLLQEGLEKARAAYADLKKSNKQSAPA